MVGKNPSCFFFGRLSLVGFLGESLAKSQQWLGLMFRYNGKTYFPKAPWDVLF